MVFQDPFAKEARPAEPESASEPSSLLILRFQALVLDLTLLIPVFLIVSSPALKELRLALIQANDVAMASSLALSTLLFFAVFQGYLILNYWGSSQTVGQRVFGIEVDGLQKKVVSAHFPTFSLFLITLVMVLQFSLLAPASAFLLWSTKGQSLMESLFQMRVQPKRSFGLMERTRPFISELLLAWPIQLVWVVGVASLLKSSLLDPLRTSLNEYCPVATDPKSRFERTAALFILQKTDPECLQDAIVRLEVLAPELAVFAQFGKTLLKETSPERLKTEFKDYLKNNIQGAKSSLLGLTLEAQLFPYKPTVKGFTTLNTGLKDFSETQELRLKLKLLKLRMAGRWQEAIDLLDAVAPYHQQSFLEEERTEICRSAYGQSCQQGARVTDFCEGLMHPTHVASSLRGRPEFWSLQYRLSLCDGRSLSDRMTPDAAASAHHFSRALSRLTSLKDKSVMEDFVLGSNFNPLTLDAVEALLASSKELSPQILKTWVRAPRTSPSWRKIGQALVASKGTKEKIDRSLSSVNE